ncbi:MAG: pilus assembly protein PilC [Frankiales bacterium]|nr:pilus assembly protein PilC [Frankiales bacterium]
MSTLVETAPPGEAVKSARKSILQLELTKKKIPRKDLMHFSRQLAVFIKAGIPIMDALEAIQEEMGNKEFHAILADVIAELRQGSTFADAMEVHASVFPQYYLGILRSAEATGHLDLVLVQLSVYIERDLEARRKVASALAYPGIITGVALVVVVVLVSYVLPKFETFFAELHAKLPLPTRMLLSSAHFLTAHGVVILTVLVVLIVCVAAALRSERGKLAKDTLLLRLPVLGDLVSHMLLERFCRILSSMMRAGVPLPHALAVTTEATSNRVFQRGLATARDAMMRGEGLAVPLSATGLFPAAARQMFRVGESTGTLDEQLETAAGYFDTELDYKIKRFTTLFEPAVLLFVGLIVGFVAIALVSAMYGIFRQVKP